MPPITRRVLLKTAAASLIASAFPALADERNNPYRFRLLPGATLSISVTFNSDRENVVSLWNELTGGPGNRFPQWPGCGNYDRRHPTNFVYTSGSDMYIPFAFNAGYKLTPPNLNQAWHFSAGVVKSYSERAITLGYSNIGVPGANDTNCVITVTVTSGELPNGK